MRRTAIQALPFLVLWALVLPAACRDGGSPAADAGTAPPDANAPGDGGAADAPLDVAPPEDVGHEVGGDAGAPPAALPRLRAEGTRVVAESGADVALRGVNLGGWLFHETWVTLVDHSLPSRIWQLAGEQAIADDVEAVFLALGPPRTGGLVPVDRWGGDEGWLQAVEAGLAERLGEESAAAFLDDVRAFLPDLFDDSDLPLLLALERRFGAEGREELLGVFQDAWIRPADLAWLAAQGFTLVRVPMTWRELTHGPLADPPTALRWDEAALARVDGLLDRCEALGLYAVLDIQEAPGGQNDYSGEPRLYVDPAMQDLTVELWERLSDRYRERSVVAAYSLLAEPLGAPSTAARDAFYDRLVKAIRARGDDHLLVVHDGFFGMATLPDPAAYGWTNVIYSTHLFEWSARGAEAYRALLRFYDALFTTTQARHGVPYFIGSFSTIWDQPWAYEMAEELVAWFEAKGWPWSLWTFKRLDDPLEVGWWGESTSWGLLGRLHGAFDRPDVLRDDRGTLRAKLAAYAALDLRPNEALLQALTRPWRTPAAAE
jgi:hypothetical protein